MTLQLLPFEGPAFVDESIRHCFPWPVLVEGDLWKHQSSHGSMKSSHKSSFPISITALQLLHYRPKNFLQQAAPCSSPCYQVSFPTAKQVLNKEPSLNLCAQENYIFFFNHSLFVMRRIKWPKILSPHERTVSMLVILQQDAELQVRWLPGLQGCIAPALFACSEPWSTENTTPTIHS